MNENINMGIHNHFDVEVIRAGKIIQKAQAFNVVTNKLWDYLLNSTNPFGKYIQYGSGSGTPSASDSSLFNREGGAEVTEVSIADDNARHIITRVCSITLGLSTAVGVTLTEIGIAGGSGDDTLTTHAMLQDMNGNPISIEKTDTDIINIYATIYCHWNVDGNNVAFHPDDGWQRTAYGNQNAKSQFRETLTGKVNTMEHMGFGVAMGNCLCQNNKAWTKSINLSQRKVTYTAPRYIESEGNIGGITHIVSVGTSEDMTGLAIKCGAKSWSKYHVAGESVGTGDGETTEYKTKIGLPENAVVKINGNRVNNVTVKKIPSERIRLMRIDGELSTDGNLVYSPTYEKGWSKLEYFYNPDYEEVGFVSISIGAYYSSSTAKIYVSNDLIDWTLAVDDTSTSSTHTATIPEQYRHYKYYRIEVPNSNDVRDWADDIPNNIIFNTAPAVGDVITIDYDTECIPKDTDHVFDASITFTFGEYTE